MIKIIPINPVKPAMSFTAAEIIAHVTVQLSDNPNGFSEFIHNTAGMLWQNDHKVSAMRLLRTFFPTGLKEVKEYCESSFN